MLLSTFYLRFYVLLNRPFTAVYGPIPNLEECTLYFWDGKENIVLNFVRKSRRFCVLYCTVIIILPALLYNVQYCIAFFSLPGLYPVEVIKAGLGIRSFHFRANRLFFVQKWANKRFAQKNDRFTHSLIFGEWNEWLTHIAHKKEEMSENEQFANFFE